MVNRNKNKNFLWGCDYALLTYGGSKSSSVFELKWTFLGLQQNPENSVLAPLFSQDLLGLCNTQQIGFDELHLFLIRMAHGFVVTTLLFFTLN